MDDAQHLLQGWRNSKLFYDEVHKMACEITSVFCRNNLYCLYNYLWASVLNENSSCVFVISNAHLSHSRTENKWKQLHLLSSFYLAHIASVTIEYRLSHIDSKYVKRSTLLFQRLLGAEGLFCYLFPFAYLHIGYRSFYIV